MATARYLEFPLYRNLFVDKSIIKQPVQSKRS